VYLIFKLNLPYWVSHSANTKIHILVNNLDILVVVETSVVDSIEKLVERQFIV